MIEREVASLKDSTQEELKQANKNMDINDVVDKEYNELRMYKVTDMHNFELMGDQSVE